MRGEFLREDISGEQKGNCEFPVVMLKHFAAGNPDLPKTFRGG